MSDVPDQTPQPLTGDEVADLLAKFREVSEDLNAMYPAQVVAQNASDCLDDLVATVEARDTRLADAHQALWDVYGALGFDQDGDKTPGAMRDLENVVRSAAEEFRRDYDSLLDEVGGGQASNPESASECGPHGDRHLPSPHLSQGLDASYSPCAELRTQLADAHAVIRRLHEGWEDFCNEGAKWNFAGALEPMTPGEVAAIAAARATEGDSGDESFNDPIRGDQVTEGYTGRLCSKSFASNPANCTTPVPDAAGWGVCNTCGETLNITGELIPEHRTETPT